MSTLKQRLTLVGVFLTLLLAARLPAQGGAAGLIAQGNQLLLAGDYRQAALVFERARRIAGNDCLDCQVGLGRAYFGLEDYAKVIPPAQAAIGLAGSPVTLGEMARLLEVSLWHEQKNRPAMLRRSVTAFRKVLRTGGPGERTALTGLLHTLARLGRTGDIVSLVESRLLGAPAEARAAVCAAHPAPLPPGVVPAAFQAALNRELDALGWDGPYFVAGEVERPARLNGPPPTYTEEARRRRITGTVVVRGVVTAAGGVSGLEVLAGLPFGLSEAAVDAIRRWSYEPAILHGAAVPVCQTVTISFQIQ